MLLAVLSGFIVASFVPLFGKFLRGKWSVVMTALPLSLFIYFLTFIEPVSLGKTALVSYEWVPSMGINFTFLVDGLSLLFALMITGIGALVFLYTSAYMKDDVYLDRFYGYLCIFMGAMLGMVLSDNIFTLFVFWELTSISSFFLIGYNNESKESRKSALIALGITGLGGFFLLAAFALLGNIAGTYSISEMVLSAAALKDHGLYLLIMIFLFIAAFSKSAQYPLHFWLPGAMKAPTPVSTYLHSATMVKAGIYLLARFTPVLGDVPVWNNTLMIVGGFTMLYAAFHSIFKKDLKEILAYSTISALGMLVFLIGLGTSQALLAATVFIIVHALYKASLFLITGIIDHETGTRDINKLSGLRKVMMPVAIAGLLAMLSNSGIPPTFGFVGKDLIYESTMGSKLGTTFLTAITVITNIFLLYASIMAGLKPLGAVKYFTLNFLASMIFLTAIAVLYGLAGSLNMAELSGKIQDIQNRGLVQVTAILFLVGFGIKSAIFPLYFWLPDSYHTPQAAISSIFAGLLTKVGIYALLRVFSLIFIPDPFMKTLVVILAGFTLISGGLGAVVQTNMRKMFSYLIVCHIGYMIGGLGMFTVAALSGAIFYLIHDIIIKTNLFLVGGLVYKINGELNMNRMGGIYANYPALSLLIAVPLFSLIGVPPLSGFWPKINLFSESLKTSNYFLLGSLIFGSVITLFVITRFWSEAFWKKMDNPIRRPHIRYYDQMPYKQKAMMIIPIIFLSTISLYIGLNAENIFRLSNHIATELIDTSPYINAVLGITQTNLTP